MSNPYNVRVRRNDFLSTTGMVAERMRLLLLAALAAPAVGFRALLGVHQDGLLRHEARSVPCMAGGTPRVPWKAPGMENPQWIDVFNRMYRERIMFMGQNIDDNFANTMISVMLYLESEDANSPVAMYFNVAGGVMKSGLAMYDTMRIMPYDIQTVNMGICAQVSAFLVAGGTKGKRFALPNSRFAMQNPGIMPPLDEKGNPRQRRMQATEMQLEVQETLRDKKRMLDGFASFTGRSLDQLSKDFSRDFYLTADEAMAYGMVDQLLLRKRAEVTLSRGDLEAS